MVYSGPTWFVNLLATVVSTKIAMQVRTTVYYVQKFTLNYALKYLSFYALINGQLFTYYTHITEVIITVGHQLKSGQLPPISLFGLTNVRSTKLIS